MIDQPIDRETVEAIERQRLLVGFLPYETAVQAVQQSDAVWDSPAAQNAPTSDDFEARWNEATAAIDELDYSLDRPTVEELPESAEIDDHVERLSELDHVAETYGDDPTEYRIRLVPIEKLIALQATVTTTAYEDIPRWEDDPMGVLEYVFPTERAQGFFQQSIQTPDNQLVGIQLTSRAPNVSVEEIQIGDGPRIMEKQIAFTVRAKPNLVNVARYEGRLLLMNGYHRTYQLMQNGETHVPAFVRDVDAFPDGLDFSEELAMSDRPPMLPDFNTDAATTIRKPAMNELIRITAETTKVFR